MPIGGFESPSGRRVRSVERALTASTLLPTVAFAALGTVTVLLVAQMGMPPLGGVAGSSAHDGGRAVTMPRMWISVDPPLLPPSTPARDRETTTADAPTDTTGPRTLTLALPAPRTIAPPRTRETTAAGDPTGPTSLIFARQVAHTFAPPSGHGTTADDAQPAAMTAGVTDADTTKAVVTDADATDADATDADATTWEVITREATIAAVLPQAQADADVMAAPEVMYTLLARATMAPECESEPEDQQSLKSRTGDTSVTSVKTTQGTPSTDGSDGSDGSEHAKAGKSGP